MDLITNISVIGSTVTACFTFIDLESFKNKHKDVEVYYNEIPGDILTGRNILDEYSITFDGRNSKLHIE